MPYTAQEIEFMRTVLSAGLTDDLPDTAIKEFTKSFLFCSVASPDLILSHTDSNVIRVFSGVGF